MQNIISTIFSTFFKYLIIISILFIWLSDIIKNIYITITISFLIAIIIDIVYNALTKKKRNVISLSKKEKNEVKEISKQFLFTDKAKILNYFYGLLSQNHKSEIKNDYIIITKENERILIAMSFNCIYLNNEDIISTYNKCKNEKIVNSIILTNKFNEENTTLINMVSDIKITIYDIDSVYKNIISKYNTPPNFDIELSKIKKLGIKEITKHAFNKKLAKNYFLSGVLLLFASFFTKYKLYYTIMSTLLLFFSLICIFRNNNKATKINESNIL